MRRHLVLFSVTTFLFTLSTAAIAGQLDAETIKFIHEQTKIFFMKRCQKEMTGGSYSVCDCLANKAAMALDDKALSQCTNDESGSACISKAVTEAAQKALSKENMNECNPGGSGPGAASNTDSPRSTNTANNLPPTQLSRGPDKAATTKEAPATPIANNNTENEPKKMVEAAKETTSKTINLENPETIIENGPSKSIAASTPPRSPDIESEDADEASMNPVDADDSEISPTADLADNANASEM